MKRCRRCLIPDTRPDTQFVDGVCGACLAYERRPQIDWDARKKALLDLLERHHGRCIVPSSGGKDSHYQVMTLLELGAKVTVVTAETCFLTDVGRMNIENLAGYADTIEIHPHKDQRANLNRLGMEMVGDISWPEHVGIFTIPWRMACYLGIPLIFYGENPQDQYGGPQGSEGAMTMTARWVSEFGGFLGLRARDMETMVTPADMSIYMAPPAAQVQALGLEAHFLGQYIPWDSHRNAEVAIEAGMTFQRPCPGNWWPWENQDNAMTGIHDYQMYRKYGYGRADAQLSVDIRTGRIKRDTALAWIHAYRNEFPAEYMGVPYEQVLDRIGVSDQHFWEVIDQFTDWRLFRPHPDGDEPTLLEEGDDRPRRERIAPVATE